MTGREWLDGMREQMQGMTAVSQRLSGLADAFVRTGNLVVAGELLEYTEQLRAGAEALRYLIDEKIDSDLRQVRDGTRNMFSAMSAILQLPKEEGRDQ